RAGHVTGVQTCALPISQGEIATEPVARRTAAGGHTSARRDGADGLVPVPRRAEKPVPADRSAAWRARTALRISADDGRTARRGRSEERRVGKECSGREV